MRRQKWRVVALFLVLAVVAAACGSDDDTETGGGDTGSGSEPATGEPLKVGMICSCSGPFGSTIKATEQLAEAWAESVNDAGGINGHPVELTIHDDAGDPGTSVTRLQELISDGVHVILDSTPLDAAWPDVINEAEIPVVGGNISGIPFHQNTFFYPSGQTNDSIVVADILTAKQAGASNLAQLYCAEAPQCQESVEPHKEAGEELGVPVVYNASIAATASNYTAECVAAQEAGAEALFIGHSASVFARVAQDCERQGYHPIYIEQGTGFTMDLATNPGTEDRLWASFPILPFFVDAEPVQRMNEVLDEYAPGLRTDPEVWTTYAAQSWTGFVLIETAVEATGLGADEALSAEAIIEGLDSLEDETLNGWSPPLTFEPGEPHSVDCWFTVRVENGEPRLVNDGELTCQDDTSS